MRIAVGMSGGVDSSVAALLLKREGHEVIGLTMRIWRNEIPASFSRGNGCYGPDEAEEIEAAQATCSALGISHHTIDCRDQYGEIVLDYFRAEYRAGRTPNPCVRCNQRIKFGILPDAARAHGIGFEKFATGHYARVSPDSGDRGHLLLKGVEPGKDQSYFLYRLTQEQLAMTLFPLGSLRKAEVRRLAREAGLAVHDKQESQDFCSGDYGDLIGIETKGGEIVDTGGRVLGRHRGIGHYTIGQRRGLGVPWSEPLYVLKIDAPNNRLVVGGEKETLGSAFTVTDCVWGAAAPAGDSMNAMVKIRSASPAAAATVWRRGKASARVVFLEPHSSITPGQSAVFYDGDVVTGGGVIDEIEG